MSVRLFVGNLPYGASEAELREYFGGVGQPAQIIMPVDRETGRPRGFAFVEYTDRAVAEEAIRRFNAQMFKGRPLAVSEARPREDRGPGPHPMGGSRPGGGAPMGPRPPRAFDGPPAPGAGRGAPPRREGGGGPAPRRGARKGQWAEEKPKRPIQVRTTGRIFDVDDDGSGEEVEIDNFATSVKGDAIEGEPAGASDEPEKDEPETE